MGINWKILKTGLSGSLSDAPAMWIDQYGTSHCVWVKSGEIRYARFMGIDWEYLGNKISDSTAPILYRHCVALDSARNPMVIYGDQTGVWVTRWNGSFWEDKFGGIVTDAPYSATIVGSSPVLSFAISGGETGRKLKCLSLASEEWEETAELNLPPHDNDRYDLISFSVGEDYYLFWKTSLAGNNWISHCIYDTSEESFYGRQNLEVSSSRADGGFSAGAGAEASFIDYSSNMFFKIQDQPYILNSSSSSSTTSFETPTSSTSTVVSESSVTSTSSSISSQTP